MNQATISEAIQVEEVFDFYDGPRLYTAKDDGRLFLVLWIDDEGDFSTWLYLPLSAARLEALKNRQLDLRAAFLQPEAGPVLQVRVNHADKTRVMKPLATADLDASLLPERGEYLVRGPARVPTPPSNAPARNYSEQAFEAAIEDDLKANGYGEGDPKSFDRERAIFPGEFIAFVRATQPETWQTLEKLHGASTETVLLDDLTKALDSSAGALAVIRHGFKCFGKLVRVAYFAPAHGMNPESRRLYDANRLTVTRQLHYSTKNENSIDLVLSLNGIPIATAELKNPLTGQNAEHAKHQYKTDRDPRERIFEFKKRALVHFAVDPDVVWMTTKLDGNKTFFLPFNKGNGTAAGNPDNRKGYKTA